MYLTCSFHLIYYQFAGQAVSYRLQGLKSCKLCDDDDEDNTLVVCALTVLLP